MRRWVKWAAVALGTGVLAVGGAFAAFISGSHRTMEQFDRFVAAHGEGSPVKALLDDPFVAKCAGVTLTGDFVGSADWADAANQAGPVLQRFGADAASRDGSGTLEVLWVYLPPFGRLIFNADYQRGVLRNVRSHSLD